MPLRFCHAGDFHLDEDRYFADTAQCLEWFVEDSIRANTDLFVVDGDLTTYKQTIKERNLWVDLLIQMGNHAPVILVAGNHGKELDGDLHVLARAKAAHSIYLCTEPDTIEIGEAVVAVFPYPRKAEVAGNGHSQCEAFARHLDEFNRWFEQRPGCYKLFFGHFGVAGARVSSGQPLVGRCAEYPLDPLRGLKAQYVGLSHVHLRQQLAPRIWYAGSLSRCDYSEVEDKVRCGAGPRFVSERRRFARRRPKVKWKHCVRHNPTADHRHRSAQLAGCNGKSSSGAYAVSTEDCRLAGKAPVKKTPAPAPDATRCS